MQGQGQVSFFWFRLNFEYQGSCLKIGTWKRMFICKNIIFHIYTQMKNCLLVEENTPKSNKMDLTFVRPVSISSFRTASRSTVTQWRMSHKFYLVKKPKFNQWLQGVGLVVFYQLTKSTTNSKNSNNQQKKTLQKKHLDLNQICEQI